MSNQTRLFILVFLAFLPTVVLYGYANRSLHAAELRSSEAELLRIVEQAGHEYRHILRDTESLLGALSTRPEFVERPRGAECNRALASAMEHMVHYTAMQLIEPDGFVSCGSLALDGSLFVGDRYYLQAALANRQFTVGDFAIGRLTGKPIVGLAHPVTDPRSGEVTGVLAAYVDLDELANSMYRADVPPGATLTVIDRNGTIMVRVPSGLDESASDTVGASVGASFPTPTGEYSPYLLDGTDVGGTERVFAVQPLQAGGDRTSGHLLLGMTREEMLAEVEQVGARELQLLAFGALFMLALAWLFGHYTLLRETPEALA
jgi:hypothetical protein